MAHPSTKMKSQANRADSNSAPPGTDGPAVSNPGSGPEASAGRDSQRATEQSTTDQEAHTTSCPECECELAINQKQQYQERYCEECGYIFDVSRVDPGPEWRAFNSERSNSRCSPVNPTRMYDKGLGSEISQSRSNSVGENNRRERFRRDLNSQSSNSELMKAQALTDIAILASQLGADDKIQDRACYLFREAHDSDVFGCGNVCERFVGAAVYAAYRDYEQPMTPEQIVEHLKYDDEDSARGSAVKDIRHTYSKLCRDLDLTPQPTQPRDYVPYLVGRVPDLKEQQGVITRLTAATEGKQWIVGTDPRGVAVGAAYLISELSSGEPINQESIAEACGVTMHTLRARRDDLLENERETLDILGLPVPEETDE